MSWTTYASHPWDQINTNQRDWYVPTLLRAYMRQTRYAQTVPLRIDFTAQSTKKMIWTGLFGPEGNWNTIADTSLWLERLYPDGWRQEMTLYSYGEGMGLHKYHPLITFWQQSGGSRDVLRTIVREYVSTAMMQVIEQLIFNAYISKAVNGGVYYLGGDATSFADLATADVYDYNIIPDLELDFKLTKPWGVEIPLWDQNRVDAVAFVSPGQTHTIKTTDADWKNVLQYSDWGIQTLFRGEVGNLYGTRFIESDRNILYNFGTLTAVAPIAVAANPGDGGADPSSETVDGVRTVGQFTDASVTPTYYITLGDHANGGAEEWDVGWDTDLATSMAKFRKGDWVTIYVDPAGDSDAPYTQYGPQLSDGFLAYRQVHSVDTSNGRLTFTQPILKPMNTVVEAKSAAERDCFGYVCRGVHVHAGIHMARFGAVAGGIAAPPSIMFPPAVDDRLAMYRCTWDMVGAYAPFRPELFHLYFTAGYASSMGYKAFGNET